MISSDSVRSLSYKNKYKEVWSMMIIILAIHNSIWIPVEISFHFKDEIFNQSWWMVMENVIDVLFILDIILSFYTSFRDGRGGEQVRSQVIAQEYMTSLTFYFDILSVFGSNFIAN